MQECLLQSFPCGATDVPGNHGVDIERKQKATKNACIWLPGRQPSAIVKVTDGGQHSPCVDTERLIEGLTELTSK